jgi:hypothetical protein
VQSLSCTCLRIPDDCLRVLNVGVGVYTMCWCMRVLIEARNCYVTACGMLVVYVPCQLTRCALCDVSGVPDFAECSPGYVKHPLLLSYNQRVDNMVVCTAQPKEGVVQSTAALGESIKPIQGFLGCAPCHPVPQGYACLPLRCELHAVLQSLLNVSQVFKAASSSSPAPAGAFCNRVRGCCGSWMLCLMQGVLYSCNTEQAMTTAVVRCANAQGAVSEDFSSSSTASLQPP